MIEDDEVVDDLPESPGSRELQMAWELYRSLVELKSADPDRGRLWAIAATDAEKLFAWIGYVVGTAEEA